VVMVIQFLILVGMDFRCRAVDQKQLCSIKGSLEVTRLIPKVPGVNTYNKTFCLVHR
jgi:hypothetical protein